MSYTITAPSQPDEPADRTTERHRALPVSQCPHCKSRIGRMFADQINCPRKGDR